LSALAFFALFFALVAAAALHDWASQVTDGVEHQATLAPTEDKSVLAESSIP
jgi:hypothetical protein